MEIPTDRRWRVSSSEYLAREPWFTVRHEHMLLPNGREIPDYYLFEYPDWVNVLARTREGLYLFVTQYRPGIDDTCYELVAGVMDSTDASPEAAARRELLEESGYGGGNWRLLTTLSANPATHTNLTHCFVAEGVEKVGGQHLDPTEDLDVCLLDEAQVRDLLVHDEIRQALHAAPLWRYFAQNRLL